VKRRIVLRGGLASAFTLVSPSMLGAAVRENNGLQQLYPAALKEGAVNLWGANIEDLDWIPESFTKAFPGITVRLFTDLNIIARFITEARAKRAGADAIWHSEALVAPLVDRGMLAAPKWAELDVVPSDVGASGHMAYTNSYAYAFAFHSRTTSPDLILENWFEMGDSRFIGKIAASPLMMGRLLAALGTVGSANDMIELAKRLRANSGVLWTNELLEQAFASGERSLVAAMPYYFIERWMKKGLPVSYVFPRPVFVTQFGTVLPKSSPNPNAGRLLAAWMSSPVGRQVRKENLGAVDIREGSTDEIARNLRSSGRPLIMDTEQLRNQRNALIPVMDRAIAGLN
jgi:ABC-type Fe3+ transport system substrate-binding protein